MKFISFDSKWPADGQMVLVRFQQPSIDGSIVRYKILEESELIDEEVNRFAVGWMPVEDLNQLGVDRNELCEGIVTFYYKEGDAWKRVGEGYTTTIDLGLSTWEFERRVWIRGFSFELSFYEKFKDADKWPVLKMEAKMPVIRRVGNGASPSVIYITANNVQVKEHFSDYMQVVLLQDENGYSMEMKVE